MYTIGKRLFTFHFRAYFIVLPLGLVLLSCDKQEEASQQDKAEATKQSIPLTKLQHPQKIECFHNDGQSLLRLEFGSEGTVHLHTPEQHIIARRTTPQQRSYATAEGYAFLRAKSLENNRISIETTYGQVLFELIILAEQVEIVNKESAPVRYILRRVAPHHVQVFRGDELVSESVQQNDTIVVRKQSESVMQLIGVPHSIAYALYGVRSIPIDERYVLISELLSKGF